MRSAFYLHGPQSNIPSLNNSTLSDFERKYAIIFISSIENLLRLRKNSLIMNWYNKWTFGLVLKLVNVTDCFLWFLHIQATHSVLQTGLDHLSYQDRKNFLLHWNDATCLNCPFPIQTVSATFSNCKIWCVQYRATTKWAPKILSNPNWKINGSAIVPSQRWIFPRNIVFRLPTPYSNAKIILFNSYLKRNSSN